MFISLRCTNLYINTESNNTAGLLHKIATPASSAPLRWAKSMVESITEGRAPYCRRHVDCVESVRGDAVTEAVPRVSVFDEQAKVIHEAAIGSVDKKQVGLCVLWI